MRVPDEVVFVGDAFAGGEGEVDEEGDGGAEGDEGVEDAFGLEELVMVYCRGWMERTYHRRSASEDVEYDRGEGHEDGDDPKTG